MEQINTNHNTAEANIFAIKSLPPPSVRINKSVLGKEQNMILLSAIPLSS